MRATNSKPVFHGKSARRSGRSLISNALMASVLTTGLSGAVVFGGTDEAAAQNFFQRIFNPEHQRRQEHQRQQELQRKKAVRVKVSAPKYYTYKPDAWQTVSLKGLSEVKTASVAQSAEGTPDSGIGAVTEPAAPVVLTPFDKARPALKTMTLKALPEVGEALNAFYREHPNFLWIEGDDVSPKALQAIMTLADAGKFGLNPDDYKVSMPDFGAAAENALVTAAEAEVTARQVALMQFEMELSAAVATYILDGTRGRVDPNRLSGYHDLPRHDVDLVAAFEDLSKSSYVQTDIVSHQPQSTHFKALVTELAALRAADEETEVIEIAPGTFLKAGRSSPEVKNIVAAIRKNGSEALKAEHSDTLSAYVDGEDYTPELVALVKAYQKEQDLTPDGIVGKNTIRALVGVTNAAKIAKVELAMERSRWLPEELGARKVFINQPAYTVTYTNPGEQALSMRVVVGKKSNQTNFFYDEIEVVEYNPYWGVPYSIIVNEMIPKLVNDPTYLDRSGYEVTTPSGRQVSSASVNWYAVASKQQSVNVRQYPGRSNALGEVKILFPNRHHIYMHDTPHKRLFQKDARAFSHGCVRLEDPKAMAAAVLGKSKDYVTGQIAQGQNRQEKVEGNIPVYVSYFTAWPEADGTIGYFADVYDRDRHLLKALEKTEKTRDAARTS
ncbi:murein L,D-transpeptidase YcbB/YkuD [Roseibium hamelinense]|uniref:Murein L,D-transpeptidase YcbB/YkuD n=1 Tax=Roseibium hamelinense TaxID=150831 RepID=A0A562THM2_9HYPH|nr:L,D-transpeptidase family protein [Roseibium hamelinense]MTI45692.1 murein L,D-transpeptidase [Roseibium hamelinense]TWI93125.1 murein L,D-transpeptidase YcbB/YkuD [Roseibium hamelinense]